MNEAKYCTQCGANNPPDSLFCVQCGAPIQHAAKGVSVQSSEPLRGAQPPPKWRRYVIIALVAVVVVAAAVAAIPYIFPSQPSNYAGQITTYYQREGDSIVIPFSQTTIFGADAYVGTVGYNFTIYNITFFSRNSYADAQSFQQTAVNQFESLGYVHQNTVNGEWFGVTNNSLVGVAALRANETTTGTPAVLVVQNTLLPPPPSSNQTSTAS